MEKAWLVQMGKKKLLKAFFLTRVDHSNEIMIYYVSVSVISITMTSKMKLAGSQFGCVMLITMANFCHRTFSVHEFIVHRVKNSFCAKLTVGNLSSSDL